MRISKKQLRRIIKEEKSRLLNERVQEGVSRGMYIALQRCIDEHTEDLQLNIDDPSIAMSIVQALHTVARELKDHVRGPAR